MEFWNKKDKKFAPFGWEDQITVGHKSEFQAGVKLLRQRLKAHCQKKMCVIHRGNDCEGCVLCERKDKFYYEIVPHSRLQMTVFSIRMLAHVFVGYERLRIT